MLPLLIDYYCTIDLLSNTAPPRSHIYSLSPAENMEEAPGRVQLNPFNKTIPGYLHHQAWQISSLSGKRKEAFGHVMTIRSLVYHYALSFVPSALEQLKSALIFLKLEHITRFESEKGILSLNGGMPQ